MRFFQSIYYGLEGLATYADEHTSASLDLYTLWRICEHLSQSSPESIVNYLLHYDYYTISTIRLIV